MSFAHDISTLNWVKGEIDETLRQARLSLEAYAENPADETQLNLCSTYLHQVRGTLQMVELDGAYRLAAELEVFADRLPDGERREPALEALMRGILLLPDYLEGLQAGNPDSPLVLLPLVNELRRLRGEQELTPAAVFEPNLAILPPPSSAQPSVDFPAVAAKLRRFYQAALLNLLQDKDRDAPLKTMAAVFEKLLAAAEKSGIRQWLWVSGGFVEALREGGLTLDARSRQLLGKNDPIIKRLSEAGEAGLNADALAPLVKALLYELGKSTGHGRRVQALREAFHLRELLPDAEALERYRSSLGGFNAQLKETLSRDVLEELSRVKDVLDLMARSDLSSSAYLEPVTAGLSRVAEVLDMVRQDALSHSLRSQLDSVKRLVADAVPLDEDTLMELASVVLAVESALDGWGAVAPLEQADDLDGQLHETETSPEAEAEHRRVIRRVMKEAKDELIRVREAINRYLSEQDATGLVDVPRQMRQIVGSLTMLSYSRVATILSMLQQYVEERLGEGRTLPDEPQLDALADAFMGVEYYLEAFVENRVHPGSMLDVAENALSKLGMIGADNERGTRPAIDTLDSAAAPRIPDGAGDVPGEGLEAADIPVSLSPAELDAPESESLKAWDIADDSWLDGGQSAEITAGEGNAEPTEIPVSPPQDQLDPDASGSVNAGEDESWLNDGPSFLTDVIMSDVSDAPAENPVFSLTEALEADEPAVVSAPTVEIDDEIVEIFFEEAEEELRAIGTALPQWMKAPENAEVLGNLRRSFHTLKGSGRLVGASELGEFAWAFENLLNRVIERNVPVSDALFALLGQTEGALSQLLLRFHGGDGSSDGIRDLQEAAERLSRGESTTTNNADSEEDSATEPLLDPVLRDIYTKETDSHLSLLQAFIDQCDADEPQCQVNDSLVRALHTLRGSSRAAGIGPVAELTGVLEKYARLLQSVGQAVDATGLKGLMATRDYVRQVLTALSSDGAILPQSDALQAEVDALYEAAKKDLAAEEHQRTLEALSGLPDAHDDMPPTEMTVDGVQPASLASEADIPTEAVPATRSDVADTSETDVDGAMQDVAGESDGGSPAPARVDTLALISEDGSVGDKGETEATKAGTDDTLLVFLDEAEDIIRVMEQDLQAWRSSETDFSAPERLHRHTHTLKGSARWAGVVTLADAAHAMEAIFQSVITRRLAVSAELFRVLEQVQQWLVDTLRSLHEGTALPAVEDVLFALQSLQEDESPSAHPVTDHDPELLEIFLEEAQEILADSDGTLQQWGREPEDRHIIETLQRQLHTLKGGARMAGVAEIGDLSHAVESMLAALAEGRLAVSGRVFTLIQQGHDRLAVLVEQLRNYELLSPVSDLVQALEAVVSGDEGRTAVAMEPSAAVFDPAQPTEAIPDADPSAADEHERRRANRPQNEMVRVRSDLLDHLVNVAGESSIFRTRIEQQVGSFRSSLDELGHTVERFRQQLRAFDIETEAQIQSRHQEMAQLGHDEFDPLEFDRFTVMQQISRSMVESLSDLSSLDYTLGGLVREAETMLVQQARINTELQEGLMHTRMVPLVQNAPRLRRVVRQIAEELGKEAELHFHGAEVEMDRNVVERILAPIEHLLRNAIAHGLESPEQRAGLGKPSCGKLVIEQVREGTEVVLRIADDGGGINLERVRSKAIERGLIAESATLSDQQIAAFILESGLSTAQQLSQISGRGVGLDVVNSEVKGLNGTLAIESRRGAGTTFTIRLPLTLTVSRSLLVQVAEEYFALPLVGIRTIERVSHEALLEQLRAEQPDFEWLGDSYHLLYLGAILGLDGHETPQLTGHGKSPVLLVQAGEHRVALVVDALIGSREVVVKPVGKQLGSVRGLAGATILGDGNVAFILDLPALARASLGKPRGLPVTAAKPSSAADRKALVMVVDDSITVRKVTERLLQRNGMRAVTARDGVDALALLEEVRPDVMLLDIEMPRMDGYELATHIRNEPELAAIPIIMITSRSGEKHRARAMQIGVDIYMSKPYQESQLLEGIAALLNKEGTALVVG